MAREWTTEEVMTIAGGYHSACILFAAADLDIFSILDKKPMTAQALAAEFGTDCRATRILLDALAGAELLTKNDNEYSVPSSVAELLTDKGAKSILSMVRHQANCLRRWVQLPQVIKSGKPAEYRPSIRGEAADQAAFIGAMDNVSAPVAAGIIDKLQPLSFRHLLDTGGALGTWTIGFLQAVPDASATLFDLPDVIPMAKKHIAEAGLTGRVNFVPGDFYIDQLPGGADFIWLSAIAHQNSRKQNQALFAKIYAALEDNGVLVLRDVVMDDSRTRPQAGAMFAINMLVATEGGGTYSFEQYRLDLLDAGFADITLICRDEFMHSLIRAVKL